MASYVLKTDFIEEAPDYHLVSNPLEVNRVYWEIWPKIVGEDPVEGHFVTGARFVEFARDNLNRQDIEKDFDSAVTIAYMTSSDLGAVSKSTRDLHRWLVSKGVTASQVKMYEDDAARNRFEFWSTTPEVNNSVAAGRDIKVTRRSENKSAGEAIARQAGSLGILRITRPKARGEKNPLVMNIKDYRKSK